MGYSTIREHQEIQRDGQALVNGMFKTNRNIYNKNKDLVILLNIYGNNCGGLMKSNAGPLTEEQLINLKNQAKSISDKLTAISEECKQSEIQNAELYNQLKIMKYKINDDLERFNGIAVGDNKTFTQCITDSRRKKTKNLNANKTITDTYIFDISFKDYKDLYRNSGVSEVKLLDNYASMSAEQLNNHFLNVTNGNNMIGYEAPNARSDCKHLDRWIKNTGDINLIQDYYIENQEKLNIYEKIYLMKRVESMKKIERIKSDVKRKVEAGIDMPIQTVLEVNRDKDTAIIHNVHQKGFQSSNNGCWSCSSAILAQTRGIDVDQEEIRAYRPILSKAEAESVSEDTDYSYNADSENNVLDRASAIVEFVPNSMVKEFEIYPYTDEAKNAGISQDEYYNNAKSALKEQIINAISNDKSTVSFLAVGHVITIVGIEGEKIYYKDSAKKSAGDPDFTHFDKTLDDLLSVHIDPKQPKDKFTGTGVRITWISDIELAKDEKTLYGIPSEHISMKEDGELKLPPDEYYEKGLGNLNEKNKGSALIYRVSGVEDTLKEQEKRNVYEKKGIAYVEKVYLPKKLNANQLKLKAQRRSAEREKELQDQNRDLLGISLPKKEIPNKDNTDKDIVDNNLPDNNLKEADLKKSTEETEVLKSSTTLNDEGQKGFKDDSLVGYDRRKRFFANEMTKLPKHNEIDENQVDTFVDQLVNNAILRGVTGLEEEFKEENIDNARYSDKEESGKETIEEKAENKAEIKAEVKEEIKEEEKTENKEIKKEIKEEQPVYESATTVNNNDYEFLFDENHIISKEEEQKLAKDFGVNKKDEFVKLSKGISDFLYHKGEDSFTDEQLDDLKHTYSKAGVTSSRPNTTADMFVFWALGAKDLSYEEVRDIYYNPLEKQDPQIRKEFYDFCKNNPIINMDDNPKEYMKGIKSWADIMMNATEKVKAHKIPDVDYTDEKEALKATKDLLFIRNMGIDFSQEFRNLLEVENNNQASFQNFANAMGGNDKLAELETFWHDTQSSINNLGGFTNRYIKGINVATRDAKSSLESLGEAAIAKYFFENNMKKFAGKDLGTIVKGFSTKDLMKSVIGEKANDYYYDAVNEEHLYDGFDMKTILSYLTGSDKKPFEDVMAASADSVEDKVRTYFNDAFKKSFLKLFESVKDSEYLQSIKDTPADGMIELLINDENGINKTRNYITNVIRQTFGNSLYTTLHKIGLKFSDLIMIDGKTPEKLYGLKYSKVKDPNERELLYTAEILKEMARGEKQVSYINHEFDKNGVFKATGAHTLISDTKKNILRNYAGYNAYKEGEKSILNTLKRFKAELLLCHEREEGADDEKAIEDAKKEFGKTGSSLYQALEKNVDDCIKCMSDDRKTMAEKKEALEKLNTAAVNYYRERKGIKNPFGPNTGKLRLTASKNIKNVVPNLVQVMDDLTRQMSSDMLVTQQGNRIKLHTCNLRTIKKFFDGVIENHKDTYNLPEYKNTAQSQAQIKAHFDKISATSNEKVKLINSLKKFTNVEMDLSLDLNDSERVLKEGGVKLSYKDFAVNYCIKDYLNNMNKKDVTAEKIRQMQESIDNGDFKKQVNALYNNKLFKEVVKSNPGKYYTNWKEISSSTNELQATYKLQLDTVKALGLKEYVLYAGVVPNNHEVNEDDGMYMRLTSVVVAQILSDKKNEGLCNEIQTGNVSLSDVFDSTNQYLKEKRILAKDRLGRVGNNLGEQLRNNKLSDKVNDKVVKTIRKLGSERAVQVKHAKNTYAHYENNSIKKDEIKKSKKHSKNTQKAIPKGPHV